MPTIANRSVQAASRELRATGTSEVPPRRRARPPFDTTATPPSPARELARRALDVLRGARLASPPERWLRPGFGREVDLVRLHLAPVRTRGSLAGSFGREAFNIAAGITAGDGQHGWHEPAETPPPREAASIGPVHVAYALRWLELGDGRQRPAFIAWLADPAEPMLR